MKTLSPTLRTRFFTQLAIEGGCLVWRGLRSKEGYGVVYAGRRPNGGVWLERAHRVSWFLKHGEWPDGYLLHSCDNPACVRLRHLRIGTAKENMQDKVDRGRQLRGEAIHNSKLTEAEVVKIRQLCQSNLSYSKIGAKFGVAWGPARSAHRLLTWKHVEGGQPLSDERRMRQYAVGDEMLTVAELAERAGVALGTIYGRINRGLTGEALIRGRHRAPRRAHGTARRT